MRIFTCLTWSVLLLACCSCKQKPETLVTEGYDEQEMDRAMARARGEVETFIAALEAGAGTDFAVKAPVVDRGETEHFWLTDVVYQNGEFTGLIGNDPGVVNNVKFGQKWSLGKQQISDWMFMREGKMHGNYTLRPLLKTMPREEAEMFQSLFVEP